MADLSAAQIKAILALKLQRAGMRPSAADIRAKEVLLLQGDALMSVRCHPCAPLAQRASHLPSLASPPQLSNHCSLPARFSGRPCH